MDVSISMDSEKENKIKTNNDNQNDILETALKENDVDTVMKCYKSLSKEKRSTIGLDLINLILNVKDEQRQFEILQHIFEHRAFNRLALHYRHQLGDALSKLNGNQLESILNKMDEKTLRQYRWIYGKVAQLRINSDTEGYIRSLEENDTGSHTPSHGLIRQVIESSPKNAEQFFTHVINKTETDHKLAVETIKACLITGENASMVEKIWKMIEGHDLTRETFREGTLTKCSNQELFPVKEFFLSCISSPSVSDVTRKSLKEVLPAIYNRLVANAIDDKSKSGEGQISSQHESQNFIKEALSKWIDLDRLSDQNLRSLQNLPDLSEQVKKEASGILDKRAQIAGKRRGSKIKNHNEDSSSSSDSN